MAVLARDLDAFEPAEPAETHADVVVYTAAGVTAGVAAAQRGKSVLLIEPAITLAGCFSAGWATPTCWGRRMIGGLAAEVYRRIVE